MIAKRGYSDRVDVMAGDMFADALPRDHDIHLFSNVLHDWDVEKVRPLLAASFAALPSGGLLVIHDAHLNADKSAQYRIILEIFARSKEAFILHLRPAEIARQADIAQEEASILLDALEKWGNLTSLADTSDVATVEEF
jgi:predicted O-methyltransferase YrrM